MVMVMVMAPRRLTREPRSGFQSWRLRYTGLISSRSRLPSSAIALGFQPA